MNKLMKIKNKVIATVISSMVVANMMAMTAYAEGDVSGAIQSTWNEWVFPKAALLSKKG